MPAPLTPDMSLTRIAYERGNMAKPDFTPAQKPFVYDLMGRLNAAFARVHRNMNALEQFGIFDPLMMQVINRQSEGLQAGANHYLLGAMRSIEQQHRTEFGKPWDEGKNTE
jgi:hypothetical protein